MAEYTRYGNKIMRADGRTDEKSSLIVDENEYVFGLSKPDEKLAEGKLATMAGLKSPEEAVGIFKNNVASILEMIEAAKKNGTLKQQMPTIMGMSSALEKQMDIPDGNTLSAAAMVRKDMEMAYVEYLDAVQESVAEVAHPLDKKWLRVRLKKLLGEDMSLEEVAHLRKFVKATDADKEMGVKEFKAKYKKKIAKFDALTQDYDKDAYENYQAPIYSSVEIKEVLIYAEELLASHKELLASDPELKAATKTSIERAKKNVMASETLAASRSLSYFRKLLLEVDAIESKKEVEEPKLGDNTTVLNETDKREVMVEKATGGKGKGTQKQ